MPASTSDTTPIRLAELMAALSLATDLGMGQPLEFALHSCVLAVRLGASLGMDDTQLREVYYQALLRYIGCNAETATFAAIVGDELALRADVARYDTADQPQMMGLILRYIRQAHSGASPVQLARTLAQGLLTAPQVFQQGFAGHCEVAQRLAARRRCKAKASGYF